jgi:hypothetical protein
MSLRSTRVLRRYGWGVTVAVAALSAPIIAGGMFSPAGAVTNACLNTEAGRINAVQRDSYTYKARGTRASVGIIAPSGVSCQHIGSVFVFAGSGFFEFGYVIGYSNCSGHRGKFFKEPTLFWWAVNSRGQYVGCNVWETLHPLPGTMREFRASDLDANRYWGAWYIGKELMPSGVKLDFTEGANAAGMERGDANDNGYQRFESLSEWHPGSPGDHWSGWDNITQNRDIDPSYRLRPSGTSKFETVRG